jgi:uncharacterized protein
MLTRESILSIVREQYDRKIEAAGLNNLDRTVQFSLPESIPEFVRIITGIRRCGKSTLVQQYIRKFFPGAFYLNFDDPRLYGFSAENFLILDEAIAAWQKEKQVNTALFFDEIQSVPAWELYIREKLESGAYVTVTGSNASLLSAELGTRLTGRHLDSELFPFSFTEYCSYCALPCNEASFMNYMKDGGFPEYLKYRNEEILSRLFDDILTRDVVVRYGVRDGRALKMLAVYLAANCANLITAGKLSAQFSIKSTATVLEYLSHFEQCYLFSYVPKFSWSPKVQAVNPRKVYCIDPGLINAVSTSSTRDEGRLFENTVFMHLRRKQYKICYYADDVSDCDFVFGKKERPEYAVQVCAQLDTDNRGREVKGIVHAVQALPSLIPCIVTLNQNDVIQSDGIRIPVIPAADFFTQNLKTAINPMPAGNPA